MININIDQILKKFARGRTDVTGIDLGRTGVKVAVLKRAGGGITLTGAGILPVPAAGAQGIDFSGFSVSRYASLAVSDTRAVIKLLSLPGHHEEGVAVDQQIQEHMGLDANAYRIGYKVIAEGHGRSETKVVAIGLPEEGAVAATNLFKVGTPVPISLEVSGLAALTTFVHGAATAHEKEAVGVVEFGAESTFLAFFNNGVLVLLRKFDLGSSTVQEKIQQTLGVDADTARGIISDGSFDISQAVNEVLDPFLRQLVISRDFIERRDQCRVAKVFVSGSMKACTQGMTQFQAVTGVEAETWDPFVNLTVAQGAVPASLQGQESRLTAAIGAGLAALEQK